MLKAQLHCHAAEDPHDWIPHSARDLIDRAADLGFQVLAITLHDAQIDSPALGDHARSRGIVLVPGTERTIEGRHVLLLNFPAAEAERVRTLEEVARLKRRRHGLVIAPHPFHPGPTCLRGLMDEHADLFDAVELSFFYTTDWDPNQRAVHWADVHGRPLVGTADVHRLWTLDRTYSLIDARPDPSAICAAIRAGQIEVRTSPLTLAEVGRLVSSMAMSDLRAVLGRAGARLRPRPSAPDLKTASGKISRGFLRVP